LRAVKACASVPMGCSLTTHRLLPGRSSSRLRRLRVERVQPIWSLCLAAGGSTLVVWVDES